MKSFANDLLDSSAAAAVEGPTIGTAGGGEDVGDAQAQWQFRADDGQVDVLACGDRQQLVAAW